MINGLDIFYTKVNIGNGLKLITKGKGCDIKSNKRNQIG